MSIGFESDLASGTVLDKELVTTDDGDHDRFAHYADRDLIVEALVFGLELEALCGKRWVPSADPSRFPICPTCREALLQLALDG